MHNLKLIFLPLIAAGLSSAAQANTIQAQVINKNADASRVIVTGNEARDLRKGDFLSMGSDCELEVVSNSRSRLILDAGLCEKKSVFQVGKNLRFTNENSPEVADTGFDNIQTIKSSESSSRTSRSDFRIPRENTGEISRGIRFSIMIPDLDAKIKATGFGESVSQKADADAKTQIGIGYADIGMNRAGFTAQINQTRFDGAKAMRIEGSGTFGFNERVYGLLGLNWNKFTSGPQDIKDLDADFGFQIGLGFQVDQSVGFEVKSVNTKNGDTIDSGFGDSVDVDVTMSGIEMGVHATFQ